MSLRQQEGMAGWNAMSGGTPQPLRVVVMFLCDLRRAGGDDDDVVHAVDDRTSPNPRTAATRWSSLDGLTLHASGVVD